MTPKDRAINIAGAMLTAELDPTPENLAGLHEQLWIGIHENADTLGLSAEDLQEIGQAGQAARSGEPKQSPK